MKYKAIIFDMDGTIIDTEHIWEKALAQMLERRGLSVSQKDKEVLDTFVGRALIECAHIMKELFDLDEDPHDIMREKAKTAHDLYEKEVRFIEGFAHFHGSAKQKHLKMALATNAHDDAVVIVQRRLKLHQYFGEHVYNPSHVNNQSKPDPALYLHAAEQLGVDPKDCIAIEDSAHGVKAAKDAGMLCIGFNSANRPHQVQESHFVVDAYHQIDLERLLKLK